MTTGSTKESTNSTTKDTIGGSSDTASTSYNNAYPQMTAEQEFFLYELETTDSSSVGLVLRAIYDSGDVDKFARALERRIAHYDKNILKVCTYHYQGFVESMSQLTTLSSKCAEIKALAAGIDQHIQDDSSDLLKKSSEVVRYRKLQRNANIAIDQISMCLPVLENYVKLQDLMKQKKYLPALKILKELELNYSTEINKYRFTQSLAKSMGPIRDQIREKSYSELTDFLENLQKVSRMIGEDATNHIARKQQFIKSDDIAAEDEEDNVQLDFAPIHRCVQIFNVLGDKEQFEVYYRKQRREQALAESITTYVKYLNEIVGFFVVEDRIMQIEPSLVTTAHKDQLWEMTLQQVTTTMNAHFGNCLNVEMMLKMKKVILLFAITMKSYGYSIGPLFSLLQNFRDQYNEILMSEYCAQFESALQNDNYTSITVYNEAEFKRVVEQFPWNKRGQEQEPFPRKFPFSQFVPTVFVQAKGYLVGCLQFMENLQLPQSEVEDTVRRYANVLLARWSGSLKGFVTNRNRSLIQLIQITINMGYLEKSCEFLERYITEITNRSEGYGTGSAHLVTLRDQIFRDARSEVEQLIEGAMCDKVGDFLDLANYDWELSQAQGVASDYITDLINFLNTTFISFTNLPAVLARHVCMQTCKYLADRMHEMLLGPDVKAVSPGTLEQFSLDVMQCEMFTSRCPVAGFEDQTLLMAFAHLRQILDLAMQADWTTYLAERGQTNSKYSRVKASSAATLMEKMVEYEKKGSGFFGITRGDRKKLYDAILRQLRTLS
ncbi:CRE-SEC-15 protein [Aphelenchoides avenae]|nr:CRE-SEC-15 protein [Aphelenchus avenae]